MKSTIETKELSEKSKYPYLGILPERFEAAGCIVLFTSENTGTCIDKGKSIYNEMGDYTDNWAEDVFIPFDGCVYLEND